MLSDALRQKLVKDLVSFRNEIGAFQSDEQLWQLPAGMPNSAGTLALHIVGNLQHFIGAQLGDTGYVRDRRAEFEDTHLSRAELETKVNETLELVDGVLGKLDDADLSNEYPLAVDGKQWTIGDFLIRLVSHTAYHLGQLNYHGRFVNQERL